jgi:hypothetical protein
MAKTNREKREGKGENLLICVLIEQGWSAEGVKPFSVTKACNGSIIRFPDAEKNIKHRSNDN